MYSENDWRNYTLAHAMSNLDRESKWEWPGGNNSPAYNKWYYLHNKDKWKQYYQNKKNKQRTPIDSDADKKQRRYTKTEIEFARNAGNMGRALSNVKDVERKSGWSVNEDSSIPSVADAHIYRTAYRTQKAAEKDAKRKLANWSRNGYRMARNAVDEVMGDGRSQYLRW